MMFCFHASCFAELNHAELTTYIEQLGHAEAEQRTAAEAALREHGPSAAIQLLPLLKQADPERKSRALSLLRFYRIQCRELYMVGLYEGIDGAEGKDASGRPIGAATIQIDRPGKSVVIALSAYEPVIWTLDISPKTSVEQVYLFGYSRQKVEAKTTKGLEEKRAKIVDHSGNRALPFFPHTKTDIRYTQWMNWLKQAESLHPSLFIGAYSADPVDPFFIDASTVSTVEGDMPEAGEGEKALETP